MMECADRRSGLGSPTVGERDSQSAFRLEMRLRCQTATSWSDPQLKAPEQARGGVWHRSVGDAAPALILPAAFAERIGVPTHRAGFAVAGKIASELKQHNVANIRSLHADVAATGDIGCMTPAF
jgi:hypothetical protein